MHKKITLKIVSGIVALLLAILVIGNLAIFPYTSRQKNSYLQLKNSISYFNGIIVPDLDVLLDTCINPQYFVCFDGWNLFAKKLGYYIVCNLKYDSAAKLYINVYKEGVRYVRPNYLDVSYLNDDEFEERVYETHFDISKKFYLSGYNYNICIMGKDEDSIMIYNQNESEYKNTIQLILDDIIKNN